jgi:hypothetical protein
VNNDEMRPGYDTADAWLDDAIAAVVAFERAGRSVVAGAGLARLRERFEGGLGIDEDSAAAWAQFVTDRIPFPSARVNELLGQMVHRGGLLRCTKCGAAVRCECGCGTPYVGEHRWTRPPNASAADRAMAAIALHPDWSNRAIAAEIGVGYQTVGRARAAMKAVGEHGAVDGAQTEETRTGRDGRRRKLSRKN